MCCTQVVKDLIIVLLSTSTYLCNVFYYCCCCTQVVKDLILVLRSYYDLSSSTSSSLNLTVIRKGLAVLHSLAAAADTLTGRSFQSRCAEVNNEYLTLMFDIVHLFQQQIRVSEVECKIQFQPIVVDCELFQNQWSLFNWIIGLSINVSHSWFS